MTVVSKLIEIHYCCLQGQLCGLCLWFLTEWENENDSANQNDVAKMTLQNDKAALATQADGIISPNKPLIQV